MESQKACPEGRNDRGQNSGTWWGVFPQIEGLGVASGVITLRRVNCGDCAGQCGRACKRIRENLRTESVLEAPPD